MFENTFSKESPPLRGFILPRDLDDFAAWLTAGGYSRENICGHLHRLRSVLERGRRGGSRYVLLRRPARGTVLVPGPVCRACHQLPGDTPRTYRGEQPPRAMQWPLVQRLLRSIDRTSKAGWRDYTILHLVAHYGLRPSEIVAREVGSMDFENQTLRVKQCKTASETVVAAGCIAGDPSAPTGSSSCAHAVPATP